MVENIITNVFIIVCIAVVFFCAMRSDDKKMNKRLIAGAIFFTLVSIGAVISFCYNLAIPACVLGVMSIVIFIAFLARFIYQEYNFSC